MDPSPNKAEGGPEAEKIFNTKPLLHSIKKTFGSTGGSNESASSTATTITSSATEGGGSGSGGVHFQENALEPSSSRHSDEGKASGDVAGGLSRGIHETQHFSIKKKVLDFAGSLNNLSKNDEEPKRTPHKGDGIGLGGESSPNTPIEGGSQTFGGRSEHSGAKVGLSTHIPHIGSSSASTPTFPRSKTGKRSGGNTPSKLLGMPKKSMPENAGTVTPASEMMTIGGRSVSSSTIGTSEHTAKFPSISTLGASHASTDARSANAFTEPPAFSEKTPSVPVSVAAATKPKPATNVRFDVDATKPTVEAISRTNTEDRLTGSSSRYDHVLEQSRVIHVDALAPLPDSHAVFKLSLLICIFFTILAGLDLTWAAFVAIICVFASSGLVYLEIHHMTPKTISLKITLEPEDGGAAAMAAESLEEAHHPRSLTVVGDHVEFAEDEDDGVLEKRHSRKIMEELGVEAISLRKRNFVSLAPQGSVQPRAAESDEAAWLMIEANKFKDIAPITEEQKALWNIIVLWTQLEVRASGEIRYKDFIEAMLSLGVVIDAFGSALKVIKLDWSAKCGAIDSACVKLGTEYLQPMVLAEVQKRGAPGGAGADGLLWMKRTLQFIVVMLAGLTRGADLGEAVEFAYRQTLYHVHPYIVQKLAGNIKMAVPTKQVFVERLYPNEEFLMYKLREFSFVVQPKLDVLNDFLTESSVEKVLTKKAAVIEKDCLDHFSEVINATRENSAAAAQVAATKGKHRRTKTFA